MPHAGANRCSKHCAEAIQLKSHLLHLFAAQLTELTSQAMELLHTTSLSKSPILIQLLHLCLQALEPPQQAALHLHLGDLKRIQKASFMRSTRAVLSQTSLHQLPNALHNVGRVAIPILTKAIALGFRAFGLPVADVAAVRAVSGMALQWGMISAACSGCLSHFC